MSKSKPGIKRQYIIKKLNIKNSAYSTNDKAIDFAGLKFANDYRF